MNNTLLKLLVKFKSLTACDDGQDLVEYALLTTLVSLALVLSISGIANAVDNVFSKISSSLS
jgi:Flp pilus assembly pilin Flp